MLLHHCVFMAAIPFCPNLGSLVSGFCSIWTLDGISGLAMAVHPGTARPLYWVWRSGSHDRLASEAHGGAEQRTGDGPAWYPNALQRESIRRYSLKKHC